MVFKCEETFEVSIPDKATVAKPKTHQARLAVLLRKLFSAALTSLLLSCISGCGNQDTELLPVEGHLLWEDGTRVTGIVGSVRFEPTKSLASPTTSPNQGKRAFMSDLTDDGQFQLQTFQPLDDKPTIRDGIPAGEYKVRVFLMNESTKPPIIHPDYEHPERTPLVVRVESGNSYELIVDRKFEGQD